MSYTRSSGVQAHIRKAVLLAALLGVCGVAHAQILTVGDPLEAYARMLQLRGLVDGPSLMVRPIAPTQIFDSLRADAAHPWQDILSVYDGRNEASNGGEFHYGPFDPILYTYWNSGRPSGTNDGAVWQGKGNTLAASGGFFARYGHISAALRPLLFYVRNEAFPLYPTPLVLDRRSPFAHQRRSDIDTPQRFGPDPFTTFDLGQSYVRIDYRGFATGLSNENMWWGPGVQNAIIMSNNAPGFPHVFLGTTKPMDVRIGTLEGKWLWGRLTESDYFDDEEANDRRFLTAITLAYQPRWIPGLYLGTSNTLMLPPTVRRQLIRDYLGVLENPLRDNGQWDWGQSDRMVSFSVRYVLPGSGLETYFEWALADFSVSTRDFFVQPDHGRGYTAGLQKLFVFTPRTYLSLGVEHTWLEAARAVGSRNTIPSGRTYFYVHEGIQQGYTQRGQVIGAGIGPGGNAQTVQLELYAPFGRVGLTGFRTVYDNDRYFQQGMAWNPHLLHEVEFGGGIQALVFTRGFEVGAGVTLGKLLNRYWLYKNDHTNVNVTFSLRHSLGGYR